ncbi:MAG: sigma-70 family RNA polymerase sigma factor [Armatimonadetes bacterium]|nr:sigma-70 family RNA polymerase sigma factor [Armatimonadota bacterium]
MARGLAERLHVVRLLDTYGSLLTPRQRRAMRLYYLDDLSLGEIAERQGVTRQAVRDSLQRSIGELRRFERHLRLVRDGRGGDGRR